MNVNNPKGNGKPAHLDKGEMAKELGKNQPGSPKSVKAEQLRKDQEGHHTHTKHQEKKPGVDPADNQIPEHRFPTNPFG